MPSVKNYVSSNDIAKTLRTKTKTNSIHGEKIMLT